MVVPSLIPFYFRANGGKPIATSENHGNDRYHRGIDCVIPIAPLQPRSASMVSVTKLKKQEVDWFAKLAEIRSEFSIPNYLGVLARNAETWAQEISVGPFWTTANNKLTQWRTEYRSLVGSDLLPQPSLPEFVNKSESSIRDKITKLCKRHQDDLSSVVSVNGPPLPKLNDIVRTRVA